MINRTDIQNKLNGNQGDYITLSGVLSGLLERTGIQNCNRDSGEKRADRHSRNWNQSVPVQDCHGYCSKAYGTG